jgi:hypothetical protein
LARSPFLVAAELSGSAASTRILLAAAADEADILAAASHRIRERDEIEFGQGAGSPDRKVPKVISPSDPVSAWTAKANKRVQFGYGLNDLIDTEHAVIVDVEATPARTYDEVAATRTMTERTEQRFAMKPKQLAADTAYGTGRFLAFVVTAGITPHIPVWDKSTQTDNTFSRADLRWNKSRDVYICPAGKLLKTSGTLHDGRTCSTAPQSATASARLVQHRLGRYPADCAGAHNGGARHGRQGKAGTHLWGSRDCKRHSLLVDRKASGPVEPGPRDGLDIATLLWRITR